MLLSVPIEQEPCLLFFAGRMQRTSTKAVALYHGLRCVNLLYHRYHVWYRGVVECLHDFFKIFNFHHPQKSDLIFCWCFGRGKGEGERNLFLSISGCLVDASKGPSGNPQCLGNWSCREKESLKSTGILCFTVIFLIVLDINPDVGFLHIESLRPPWVKQVNWCHFSNRICSLPTSILHL